MEVIGTNDPLILPIDPVRQLWLVRFRVAEPKDGYVQVESIKMTGKPTLEDIKAAVIAWHNAQIDRAILSGHRWRDMPVWLSAENQQNYKATFDLAMQFAGQGGTLPVTFKFGTEIAPVYHKFEALQELQEFYLSTVQYVKEVLSEGWARKDNIDWTVYQQALQAYD